MASLERLIYIDDSGSPASGLAVFGWVEFAPDRWSDVLGTWLDTRKRLWREYRVPVTSELHATDFVNGRGRIARSLPERFVYDGIEHRKDFGRAIAHECLETLRCMEGLRVGAVYRRGAPDRHAATKQSLYAELIRRFESELARDDSLGLVFMDGNDSDPTYRRTHRGLALRERRVIEDAIHIDSRASQLVQMADLVAWSANASVDRHDGNGFAWGWYGRYLAERGTAREPVAL